MNERIKELAEQAEMAANKGDHVDVKIMMAKFAELLIRECVTKMALEIMDEQWVDDAVKNTYTHFGVEL